MSSTYFNKLCYKLIDGLSCRHNTFTGWLVNILLAGLQKPKFHLIAGTVKLRRRTVLWRTSVKAPTHYWHHSRDRKFKYLLTSPSALISLVKMSSPFLQTSELLNRVLMPMIMNIYDPSLVSYQLKIHGKIDSRIIMIKSASQLYVLVTSLVRLWIAILVVRPACSWYF